MGLSPQSTVQGKLQMWLTSSNKVPGPQHLDGDEDLVDLVGGGGCAY